MENPRLLMTCNEIFKWFISKKLGHDISYDIHMVHLNNFINHVVDKEGQIAKEYSKKYYMQKFPSNDALLKDCDEVIINYKGYEHWAMGFVCDNYLNEFVTEIIKRNGKNIRGYATAYYKMTIPISQIKQSNIKRALFIKKGPNSYKSYRHI